MSTEPHFLDKFVAFVDILGFKSKVEAADRKSGTSLSDILEICQKLENKKHTQAISGLGPIICPESRCHDRNLNYMVTQISDCAVISAEVSPAGIINLLSHVDQAIFGLLRVGVMVRGYVTRGQIFHEQSQFMGIGYHRALEGEQTVQAFQMSENDGATPFVEIDQTVVRYIRDETDPCVNMMFDGMTRQDSDNDVTVLYPFKRLTGIAGSSFSEPDKCRKSIRTIREWIHGYICSIRKESQKFSPEADRKSKYYVRIMDELLEDLNELEESLDSMKKPAVLMKHPKLS